MQCVVCRFTFWWALTICGLGGCTSISIDPSCPSELEVGESGMVWANEQNPGEIPTYLWEAVPSEAGTFGDSSAPSTKFKALKTGEVVIRLTASDRLYQVISECRMTVIEPVDVAVSLVVKPDPAVVGDEAALLCTSVGESEAVTFVLEQVDGSPVTLSSLLEGVATFIPGEVGDLTFSCVGETESGVQSEPSVVTVSVIAASDEGDEDEDDGRPPSKPDRP